MSSSIIDLAFTILSSVDIPLISSTFFPSSFVSGGVVATSLSLSLCDCEVPGGDSDTDTCFTAISSPFPKEDPLDDDRERVCSSSGVAGGDGWLPMLSAL